MPASFPSWTTPLPPQLGLALEPWNGLFLYLEPHSQIFKRLPLQVSLKWLP